MCKPEHRLEPEWLTLIDRDIESVVIEGHVTDVHHKPWSSRPFRLFAFLCLSDAEKRGYIAFLADHDSLYSSARSQQENTAYQRKPSEIQRPPDSQQHERTSTLTIFLYPSSYI
jgi:hypothetical protein